MAEELRRLCQQLRPLIHGSADSLWSHYQLAESPAAKAEAENMIRMMAVSYLGNQIDDREVRLPPSDSVDAGGDLYLGSIRYPGRPAEWLYLKTRDLVKHTGIFATTGSGKTHVAYNLLRQFVKRKVPFLVIDWKRSYRNLKSLPDMKGLEVYTVGRDARPFLWNPLRPPPNVHPQTWIQILSDVLEKTHVSGQGVADVLAELADAEFDAKGFYSDSKGVKEYPNFSTLKGDSTASGLVGGKLCGGTVACVFFAPSHSGQRPQRSMHVCR